MEGGFMNPILKKLQFKGQDPALVMNRPDEYEGVLRDFGVEVHDKPMAVYGFVQIFVQSLDQLSKLMPKIAKAVDGDGVVWICYPKGTSKKYKSDANRDTVNRTVKSFGFTGVSMAAIDNDWSAFRIRDEAYVKK